MTVKIMVVDVDGTLTDGRIFIGDKGELMKAFDVKDGYALGVLLPDNNIVPVILSGRTSKIVSNRCKELNITELYQGVSNKKEALVQIANKYKLPINPNGVIEGCAYIGDDLIDLPCIMSSEVSGCPNDAVQKVKETASYICSKNGGFGAVREFAEWIITQQL